MVTIVRVRWLQKGGYYGYYMVRVRVLWLLSYYGESEGTMVTVVWVLWLQ